MSGLNPAMARRRSNDNWVWAIPQLAGLLMALGMINPAFRQAVPALFALVLWGVLIIVALGLVGLTVYLLAKRRFRSAVPVSTPQTSGSASPLYSVYAGSAATDPPQQEKVPQKISTEPYTTAKLIQQLRKIDWYQFEQITALMYGKLGYVVTRRGGANPDGGIDLVLEKDGKTFAVQCKHWKTWNVGVKAVREFLGALTHAHISRGIFITLGGYTGEAKKLAGEHEIEIINETEMARMLEGTDARFDSQVIELLQDKRKFCPKCSREMQIKIAKRGRWAGQRFWACPGFPRKCRFTLPV